MAAGLNSCQFIGNLGADPEVRHTQDGTSVCSFSVAATETWMKEGQRQERTEWARIVTWGKTADLCGQYLTKGRQVFVEGRMQTREWEDRDGNKRYTTEIVARDVTFLGSPVTKKQDGGDFGPETKVSGLPEEVSEEVTEKKVQESTPSADDAFDLPMDDDDVPF